MKKRFLSGALAFLMALSVLVPFTALANEQVITNPDGYEETVITHDTAPGSVRAVAVNESSVTLSWYMNEWLRDNEGFEVLMLDAETNTYVHSAYTQNYSCKISGLTAGTDYSFKVRTYTEMYGEKYYGVSSKACRASSSPKQTKLKSAKYTKQGKAKLKWAKVKGADGYILEYSTKKNFAERFTSKLFVSSKKSSYTISGLGKSVYYFRVIPYAEANKVKFCAKKSNVKKVKVKKGASLKAMINVTKTGLSGRKSIKALTKKGVDIKKYDTTYDRIKAIYNWHAKHYKDFANCLECNASFNTCIDYLYGSSRKYDNFIWIAAGEFQNRDGSRAVHKWSVLYFAGIPYVFDPRLQGYTGDYTGNLYFGVPKKTALEKRYLFDGWYLYWRSAYLYDDLIPYKAK